MVIDLYFMEIEKMNELFEKIKNETATAEEELTVLKFLNQGIDELRSFVRYLTEQEKINSIKNDLK